VRDRWAGEWPVASARLKATGERFERNVIILVELGSEKVSRLIEFSNPAIAQSAETIRKMSGMAVPDGAAGHIAPLDVWSTTASPITAVRFESGQ
jgi:hypothetical protein